MERTAEILRNTKETEVSLSLNLEGGPITVETGIGFFDHMLTALSFYAGFGVQLMAKGDLNVDSHHTVEDVGIVYGQALRQALGDKEGIERFADAFVPMDEALCQTVLDLSGRAYLHYQASFPQEIIGEYDSCLTEEFMRAFATNGQCTLHMRALYGENAHHITEALFKSLGICLKNATRVSGEGVTSTKGEL